MQKSHFDFFSSFVNQFRREKITTGLAIRLKNKVVVPHVGDDYCLNL